MSWIGRKKIAFVPVYRPNASPPDQIPADWPNEILRRVLFDPDLTTQADRSLRTYIRTASSGRADLDAIVMPMQIIDQQNVPVDVLEGQLGAALRSQGFNAAAIVMLGGPGAGTSERAGFWARFVMAETLGTWAMELMHVLTGFFDTRCLPAYVDCPNGLGDIGLFDQMAWNGGTHPCAYTKAAIDWLNERDIAKHGGRSAAYPLHAVGLAQPPPSGRSMAVRIGSDIPYLMIEARLRVDQFESRSQLEPGIPSEGVIVYRVQTSDPSGLPQNSKIPVFLLTSSALTVGQTFTSGTNVSISVTGSIPGGFTVVVVDRNVGPAWNHNNLTAAAGAPAAASDPAGYMFDAQRTQHVVYRGVDNRIHELYWDNAGWHYNNLTDQAGAPAAAGNPAGYMFDAQGTQHVVYRGGDNQIHELYWDNAGWHYNDLTAAAGAPAAASDPAGYMFDAQRTQHVVYRGGDNQIHELYWDNAGWHHNNLTAAAGAPAAAGDPAGYMFDAQRTQHVVYRGGDNQIHELYWA